MMPSAHASTIRGLPACPDDDPLRPARRPDRLRLRRQDLPRAADRRRAPGWCWPRWPAAMRRACTPTFPPPRCWPTPGAAAPRRPRPGGDRQPQRQPLPARPRGWRRPPRGGRQALHAHAGRAREARCTRTRTPAARGVPQPALGWRFPHAARTRRARHAGPHRASRIGLRSLPAGGACALARDRPRPAAGCGSTSARTCSTEALQLFGWPDSIRLDAATLARRRLADDWFRARFDWPQRRAVLPRQHAGRRAGAALRGARARAAPGSVRGWIRRKMRSRPARAQAGRRRRLGRRCERDNRLTRPWARRCRTRPWPLQPAARAPSTPRCATRCVAKAPTRCRPSRPLP